MLSYRISFSVNLQIYTYRKHFSDIGFKASKIHLKIGRFFFGSVYVIFHRVMCLKDADGMANSEDPDQTAPLGAV